MNPQPGSTASSGSLGDRTWDGSTLISRRLAQFALGWMTTVALWLTVFALEGRLGIVSVLLAAASGATLAVAIRIAGADPGAPRVLPVTVAACVVLGLAAMGIVAAAGAYGEIFAFMLLTLYLAAALVFCWGWRAELVLLLATLGPWAAFLDRFHFFVPRLELAAAVAIGAAVALLLAEGTARNLRQVARRRRAQDESAAALAASRDAYRDLAEHAPDMIWTCDLEGRMTYANEALAHFLGVPCAAIVGRSAAAFWTDHPDNPTLGGWTAGVEAADRPIAVQCHTPRGPRWVEVVVSDVRGPGAALIGFRGVSRDVQDRRDAEAALRASEERFRNAFDYATVGMVVVGHDGKPIDVNPAFSEMLGYSPAELRTRTMDSLAHPDDAARATVETMRLVMGEIRAYQMEKRYYHRDGHVVWGLLSCSLTRDAQGQPLHLLAQIQDISERKAAETALRESEARYRSLVESQREWIVRMDLEGRVTFVNDTYAEVFGEPAEAILGRTVFHLVHPDDRAMVAEGFARLLTPPHRVLVECRNVTPAGLRWVSWEGGAILDAQGRPIELQSVGRDVTERHMAEEALRESEARYRGLVESQQELVVRLDAVGRFTFVNDAYARTFGCTREDLLGRSFLELVHPDDHPRVATVMAGMAAPPHRAYIELRNLTARGVRWVEWEGGVVVDGAGRMTEAQAVGRDVTARREAEANLRESEERFRSAFDDAGIGMALTTIDGRTVRVNPALCAMLGYSEAEMLTRTIEDVVHPDDRTPVAADRMRLEAGGAQAYRAERRYLDKRGRVLWVQVTASLVRDAAGTPLYYLGQIQDITERHRAEEALKASHEKLRLLARRQVSIREEERTRLGFDLHDDVCQELVGVGILVESLRRKLAPMAAEHTAEFERVIRYLAGVVEHLRLLARDLRPFLLQDLGLEGSLGSLAVGMSTPTLAVTTRITAPIPRLDPETEVTVYRVAQEALSNAVRHAGARAIVVTLAIAQGELTLEVRDDGDGFDPAARKAMPLGLASMEERALALGGRLEIRSAPGAGTTVVLRCPVESAADGVREPGGSSPTRSSSRPSAATTPRAAARD